MCLALPLGGKPSLAFPHKGLLCFPCRAAGKYQALSSKVGFRKLVAQSEQAECLKLCCQAVQAQSCKFAAEAVQAQ